MGWNVTREPWGSLTCQGGSSAGGGRCGKCHSTRPLEPHLQDLCSCLLLLQQIHERMKCLMFIVIATNTSEDGIFEEEREGD